jgi:hypothetical protein
MRALPEGEELTLVIEEGIRPLVDAVNRLAFASTVYSCEGHFDRVPSEKYLPTAYVTFDVTDTRAFAVLYRSLLGLGPALRTAELRLTYDCVLGRYTLSIWPGGTLSDPPSKRAAVTSAMTAVVEAVNAYAQRPPEVSPLRPGDGSALPCKEHVPPCMLVIPSRELNCPFDGLTI